jgi:cytidylate kinase
LEFCKYLLYTDIFKQKRCHKVAHRKDLIITIDGPSGVGKSTIAKMLAQKLGYSYIDTGAMYRGVAYAYKKKMETLPIDGATPAQSTRGQALAQERQGIEALEATEKDGKCGISGEDLSSHGEREGEAPGALLPEGATPPAGGQALAPIIAELLKDLHIRFEFKKETKVFLDSVNISRAIRDPEISLLASALSQQKMIREYLYKIQREIGRNGGVVLEGRDTGSVVFPNAQIKIYLDAHTEERVKRRHLELTIKGNEEALAKVKDEMVLRDKNDSERDIAPLVMPENATYIDTTGVDIAGVLGIILKRVDTEGTP